MSPPYTDTPALNPLSSGPSIDGFDGGFCLIGRIVLNDAVGATAADVDMLLKAVVSAEY